jgi:deoxyribodipyrimidine photo-lyase
MISPSPSIVWFQSDLRLADNPALSAAVRRGQPLICLYVWNPKATDYGRPGAASRWWLHYSLQSLSANLQNVGNRLLIRMGHTHAVLLDLLKSIKNAHVFWNRSCEPTALESERHILNLIKTKKVQGTGFYGNNLVDPARIKTQTGKPYRVFTPFWKRLQAQLPLSPPLPAPRTLPPQPSGTLKSHFPLPGHFPHNPPAPSSPYHWIRCDCFRRLTGHRVSVKVGLLEKRRLRPHSENSCGIQPRSIP